MKVYIQQKKTGRFVQASGLWTEDRQQAQVFPGSLQALHFCQAYELRQVDIVVSFADSRFDVRIRLD